jgi:hypothetical protein
MSRFITNCVRFAAQLGDARITNATQTKTVSFFMGEVISKIELSAFACRDRGPARDLKGSHEGGNPRVIRQPLRFHSAT